MQTTATLKVGAAFLAGIAVALGGATIYFRATNPPAWRTNPLPVTEAQENAPPIVTDSSPVEKPVAEPVDPPVVVQKSPPVAKPRVTRAKHVVHQNSGPVSLAVSKPPVIPDTVSSMDPPPVNPVVTTALPSPPVAPQPHTVILPAGTNVTVRLGEKLSTEHNYTGDTFRASLDAPIIMDGFIIADRGAKVLGKVVKAQKPGKIEGRAELSLALSEISTTDGQRVAVQTNESLRKGPSNSSEEMVKMAGAAAIGAIIGAIAGGGRGAAIGAGAGGAAGSGAVLLGHGKAAVIASESRLTFELASDITITEHFN